MSLFNGMVGSIPPFQTRDVEWAMEFKLETEPVSLTDYRFSELMGDDFFEQFGEDEPHILSFFRKTYSSGGHKIGGYAFFTQEDPRQGTELLLFQLDTDQDNGILWGDMGVCNFFIEKENLEKLDFSKVLYNWDCY